MTESAIAQRRGDRLVLRDTFAPNEKQAEFYRVAEEPGVEELLIDGSLGWGKTQAACRKMVAWAMRYGGPGWKGLVARKTYIELEDTTKGAMMHGEGGLPPALPHQLVRATYAFGTFNKVVLVNGAEILFRSLEPEHRGKIRNLTLGAFLIDQAEELDDDDDEGFVQELVGRLRDPRGPRKGIFVANPGPEEHWLCTRFGCTEEAYLDLGSRERAARRRVHGTLFDNAHNLPGDYVERMVATKETMPDYYQRFVLGVWGAFGGKRFKGWNRRLHVCEPREVEPEWEVVAGMDYGSANPTVYLSCAIDFVGRWWVVAEHYAADMLISKHAEAIKRIESNHGDILGFHGPLPPSARWLDPHSGWRRERREFETVAAEFADHGIYCARAQSERIGGWNRLEEYLMEMLPDGYPRLRIFDSCPNLIRELPNLKYRSGTDDVEKVKDHAPDALRYALMSRVPTPAEQIESNEEAHTRERVLQRIIDRSKNGEQVEEVVGY